MAPDYADPSTLFNNNASDSENAGSNELETEKGPNHGDLEDQQANTGGAIETSKIFLLAQ